LSYGLWLSVKDFFEDGVPVAGPVNGHVFDHDGPQETLIHKRVQRPHDWQYVVRLPNVMVDLCEATRAQTFHGAQNRYFGFRDRRNFSFSFQGLHPADVSIPG
jgi:hypothetical protein